MVWVCHCAQFKLLVYFLQARAKNAAGAQAAQAQALKQNTISHTESLELVRCLLRVVRMVILQPQHLACLTQGIVACKGQARTACTCLV